VKQEAQKDWVKRKIQAEGQQTELLLALCNNTRGTYQDVAVGDSTISFHGQLEGNNERQ
jgi:hypothetical protein